MTEDLSRRSIVLAGLTATATMMLAGCGGLFAGGGGSGGSLAGVNGAVALPAGSTLDPKTLSVNVMGRSYSPIGGTSFNAFISGSAPCLAFLLDPTGNGVMTGFLDSTVQGTQTINARSTAIAMAYFAIGGPMMPGASKSTLLALISAHPAIDPFATVIAAQIVADPLAIVHSNAQIAAALATAVTALSSSSQSAVSKTQPTGTKTSFANAATYLTVTPPSNQSGVSVSPDANILGIDLANTYHRPSTVYIYETQTQTGSTINTISPAKLVSGPTDLNEANLLNSFATLSGLFSSTTAYKNFTLNPIPLGLDGAADQTTYEVVAVGPSTSGNTPAFFSDPKYANELSSWQTSIDTLYGRTIFVDLLYAIILEVNGLGSVPSTPPQLIPAIKSALAVSAGTISPPSGTAPFNSYSGYITYSQEQNNLIFSDPAVAEQHKSIITTLLNPAEAQALQKVTAIAWAQSLSSTSNFMLKLASPLTGGSGVSSTGDIAKLFTQLGNSDPGVLWTVQVTKPLVTLTPANPTANAGDTVHFTVSLASSATGTYSYDWSSTANVSTFSAVGETNTGAAITTTKTAVDLIVSASEVNNFTVQVVANDISNGKHVEYGQTKTVVTVSPASTGTFKEQVFFYPNYVNHDPTMQLLGVYGFGLLVFTPPPGKKLYTVTQTYSGNNTNPYAVFTPANLAYPAPIVSDGDFLSTNNCYPTAGGIDYSQNVFSGFIFNLGGGQVGLVVGNQYRGQTIGSTYTIAELEAQLVPLLSGHLSSTANPQYQLIST